MEEQEIRDEAVPLEGGEAESERQPSPFATIFWQYRRSIAALREFFDHVNPVVADLGRSSAEKSEQRTRQIARRFVRQARDEDIQDLTTVLDWATSMRDRKVRTGLPEIRSNAVKRALMDVMTARSEFVPSETHHQLLNRSILTSLVGYFEVLLADLAHAYYRLLPGATSNEDKVLSVNELRSFASIDDAMDFVVSRRVDDLLRGDVDDWHEFFVKRLKVDLRQLVPDWAQWGELFQRRHVILHAGGRATRRYLEKVDWQKVRWPDCRPPLEADLPIDDEYLGFAIDLFEVGGLLLCQAVWKKLSPGETWIRLSAGPAGGLIAAVYPRLLTRHWYVAEHLSKWGARDDAADEEHRLICAVNRWLAIKRQGRWAEIASEVENFDCSAKHPKFCLARASLLERPEEFFAHLPEALASRVTSDELREWPILEEMRSDPRFEEALSKHEGESAAHMTADGRPQ
jgi:hypothetical protein